MSLIRVLVYFAGLLAAAAAPAGEDELDTGGAHLAPVSIRDLHYGDVLFRFYQDDYVEALVRIGAYGDFERLSNHQADAELLSGGVYLSLGLLDESTRIFQRVLAGPVPSDVADQAHFHLARIAYRRARYADAQSSLARIGAALPGQLEHERQLLSANVLMAEGRFDEAAQALQDLPDATAWAAYARFNLGVAALRAGDSARGRAMLEEVGARPVRSEERRALQDRANLALGYALLQGGAPEPAIAALARVRLAGPYTDRALLGLGWAESQAGRPERALVPWSALRERELQAPAVFESFLAVPYAYTLLAANGEAAGNYRQALQAFAQQRRRLDESIAALQDPQVFAALIVAAPQERGFGGGWQLETLPDDPQLRPLYPLLASHAFQEGLRNYRDLHLLQRRLEDWRTTLTAFRQMIDTRKLAQATRAPRRAQVLERVAPDAYLARRNALADELARIAAARDIAALAGPEHAHSVQMLGALAARIEALPTGAARSAATQRLQMLQGVLDWQFDAGYRQRLRAMQRTLREIDLALGETDRGLARVRAAGAEASAQTGDFEARIEMLSKRLEALQPRMEAVAARQQRALARLAVEELESQRRRLASYETQAQFALATLHDRAAVAGLQ